MLHHIARQALRQWPAGRLAPCRSGRWCCCRRRLFRLGRRRLGDLLFEVAEQQLQLLDRGAQLLRGGAEPLAQQLRQAQLQLLVAQHLLLQSVARRLQFGCLAFQFGCLLFQPASCARMFRLALQQQVA